MVICPCGPIWRNSPADADGDWSLRCAIVNHSIDPESRVAPVVADGVFSYDPIWRMTPTMADGDSSLRSHMEKHSIDPESRAAPAVADGVLFLWSHVEKDSNNGRW